MLAICGERSATHCFGLQTQYGSSDWLKNFFDAFATCINEHINSDAERLLASAYLKAAGKTGQNLTVSEFLMEDDLQKIILNCIQPFDSPKSSEALAVEISNEINDHMSTAKKVAGPFVDKITIDQMQRFLSIFPSEARLTLKLRAESQI
jgi:hypothetical protein